jgi:hypothetical protein
MSTFLACAPLTAQGVFAQDVEALPVAEQSATDVAEAEQQVQEIVVTAQRIRGSVVTDVPPVALITEKDIASYGASSATDLIAALSPQTGSGRGRGGAPVVLLNGQRISGFREIRDLPPEAIKQVQVFPEEVALQYGYRPDQRVINFILKDNFASVSVEIEGRSPEKGGFSTQQFETNLTSIGKTTRLNLNAEYQRASRLTEDERDIDAGTGASPDSSGNDITEYRSLLPRRDMFEVNGILSKSFAPQTNLSLNANYALTATEALLGLPSGSFLVPGNSPFSQTDTDIVIGRSFTNPGPLTRDTETNSAKAGFSFNSMLDSFRWSVTGNYEHTKNETSTVRGADFADLRIGIAAGTIDPFDPGLGSNLIFLPADTSDSTAQILDLANTLSGEILRVPAGPLRITLRNGFNRETLDSTALRSGVRNSANLRRNNVNSSLNVEVPLIERDIGALGFLGEVAVNGNYGLSDLSDFGMLTEYTAGIRWSPARVLTFQATLIGDENAPGIAQLGNPLQTTPNVNYFDFTRNETALIDVVSGGNPALVGAKRRDLKLSVNWATPMIDGLNLQVEYFRNRSNNTTASFPILTPAIEAAFPGRVTRDTDGRLLRIDQRPVNFAEERSQRLRSGFNISGGIGPQQRGGGAGGGSGGSRGGGSSGQRDAAAPASGAAAATPPSADGQQRGGRDSSRGGGGGMGRSGFGGGGFGGPGGGGSGGRWQLSLYHSYQLQDEVLIGPGVPLLDLLNGAATSNLGGTPRHQLELSGGVFYKGMGTRITGNYRTATRADGTGLPGSSDLRFSDLATLNLRFFLNFNERGNLTKTVPFLKNSRLSLGIDNVLNDVIDVRDQNGIVPISYQPGYLDPQGRSFELSFRKRF